MDHNISLSEGLNLIEFDSDEVSLLVQDIDCDIFIIVKNGGNKRLNINFCNTTSNIFIWNEYDNDLILQEEYFLYNSSKATISFADMFSNSLTRNVVAEAIEKESECVLNCAILGRGTKKINIEAINSSTSTDMRMENSTVLLQDAIFQFDAAGIVKKGAKQSTNFQKNKALTLQKPKRVNITPTLFIDENDIEAGHGCSIGDVDEKIMYYLNSRGLSKEQAMTLLVDSFLNNISTNVKDDALRMDIEQKIEGQVLKYVRQYS